MGLGLMPAGRALYELVEGRVAGVEPEAEKVEVALP